MLRKLFSDTARDSQAAGMIKVIHARVMSEELACAAVIWKVDS
jgi:hypothetical protein